MADLNPEDYNGEQLVVISIFFLCLTFISVGLRVFVRIWIMKSFQWDDWLMVVAQVRAMFKFVESPNLSIPRGCLLYPALSSSAVCIMGWAITMIVYLSRSGFKG
jgi:hypothetical protein